MSNLIYPDFTRSSGVSSPTNLFSNDERIAMALFLQNGKAIGLFTDFEEEHQPNISVRKFYGRINSGAEPLVSILKTDERSLSNHSDGIIRPYAVKMMIFGQDHGFNMVNTQFFSSFDAVEHFVSEAIKMRLGIDFNDENGHLNNPNRGNDSRPPQP